MTEPKPRSHAKLIYLNAVVSVVTVAVEFLLYITLVELFHVDVRIANVCGGALGILVNFLLSRFWVFPDARGHWSGQIARYAIATALGIAGSTGLLHVQVYRLGWPHPIAWGLANLLMFTLWTYPTNRWIVFPAKRQSARS